MLSPEFLGKVLESAPDAIVVVDPAGTIVFASRQVEPLFGYSAEELLGSRIERLLPERFRVVHLGHRRSYSRTARMRPMGVDLDLFALRKDGTELPVEISLSPIEDGERLLVAAAIRDVSDRKRIQAAFIQAREEADRANQAKSRFLATASHDLRQPLQTLSLLNGTLLRVTTDPTGIDAVAQQGRAVEAMSRLMGALLDISKLESGAIRPDPTDFKVASLFEELRSEFTIMAANKGVELRVDLADHYVHSDPSLVGQIMRNLVSNAIKYTRQGFVDLRSLVRPSEVCLEVADTGIGIPADQLPYIYDEFYQIGVATNTAREGYGLGLSIVHRLVILLGLKLEVRSEVGRGSVFALRLPVGSGTRGSTTAPQAAGAAPAPRPTASPLILLVDDDAGVRNATAMLLKVEGYRVITAASLGEAVENARENPGVNLVVTDYHLDRGETGVEVIGALRAVLGEGLGAVLVTGDTSSTIRDLKPDERIRVASKPINADALLEILKTLLPSEPSTSTTGPP
jgi:two-component system, sensor histidine kinase